MNQRQWHIWVGVILAIPLLLVGITTFFIAHEKALGTKHIELPINVSKHEKAEVRAVAEVNGVTWFATKQAVYALQNNSTAAVPGAPKDELRSLLPTTDAVLMAGKMGIWRHANGKAEHVYKADCWQVSPSAQGFLAACKEMGVIASVDGRQWQQLEIEIPTDMQQDKGGMTLAKFMMDMHTGKLFFGKEGEWIWIDILGLAMVLLSITGLVMWQRRRKAEAALKQD